MKSVKEYEQVAVATGHDIPDKTKRLSGEADAIFQAEFNLSLVGLSGELGNLYHHYRRWICCGERMDPGKVKDCLAGLLWYMTRAADSMGSSLSELLEHSADQAKRKYPEQFKNHGE